MKPLMVEIEATTSAIALVCLLLLPQAALLFNYGNGCENDSGEQTISNTANEPSTKEENLIRQIETFILEFKFKFFHKSCITDHHFRGKRPLVDTVLTSLVERRLLLKSEDKKPFFTTGRVSTVNTYLKFLPTPDDEERFRHVLFEPYKINYNEYKRIFFDSPLLPPSGELTSYGSDLIHRPPYQTNIDGEGKSFFLAQFTEILFTCLLNCFCIDNANSDQSADMNAVDETPSLSIPGNITLKTMIV